MQRCRSLRLLQWPAQGNAFLACALLVRECLLLTLHLVRNTCNSGSPLPRHLLSTNGRVHCQGHPQMFARHQQRSVLLH